MRMRPITGSRPDTGTIMARRTTMVTRRGRFGA